MYIDRERKIVAVSLNDLASLNERSEAFSDEDYQQVREAFKVFDLDDDDEVDVYRIAELEQQLHILYRLVVPPDEISREWLIRNAKTVVEV